MAENMKLDRTRENPHPSRMQDKVRSEARVESSEGEWTEPSNLDAPPARPGYVQRWVRIGIGNNPDLRNLMRAQREGWLPRKADTIPDDFGVPTISNGKFAGEVVVQDLLLCEMPAERAEQRKAFQRKRIDRQTEAIESDVHKHVPAEKLVEARRDSRVQIGGRGGPRVPPVMGADT